MASGDQIRALLKSLAEGDGSRFYAVAMQVSATEARKGHVDLAAELWDLIDRAKERASVGRDAIPTEPVTVPFAASRGQLADLPAVSHLSGFDPWAHRMEDGGCSFAIRSRAAGAIAPQRIGRANPDTYGELDLKWQVFEANGWLSGTIKRWCLGALSTR